MVSAEEVLQLFDSYWFAYGIFTSKPILSTPPTNPNPVLQVQEEPEKPVKLSRTPTFLVRSCSDQFLSSKDSFCSENSNDSPKSVLVPKLQTILSGKEVEEFPEPPRGNEAVDAAINGGKECNTKTSRIRRRRRRRKMGNSKSLSELEFEELKGFMDLGFVFSDEAKDSSLVSIIPGLQRIGKEVCDSAIDESAVSRPYLSEAWQVLDQKRKAEEKYPLMNWRIPAFGNEMELKDHLRFWAHTVASTVR